MTAQEELIHLRQTKMLLQEQVDLQKQVIAQQQEQLRLQEQRAAQQQEQVGLLIKENSLLQQRVTQLTGQVSQLTEQVKTLQERLAKDSHNSSLPPSSDRFPRQAKPRSLRKASGKKAGGQEGHPGGTLEMSKLPDEVITLAVSQCQHCHTNLAAIVPRTIERRQVVDLPPPRLQVSEYQGEWKQCPHCQQITAAAFPDGVSASVQYGPRVGAIAVYLVMQQLLPWGRTCEVLADLVGVQISEGTLARLIERTAQTLVPVETHIKEALLEADVLHQDESGMHVSGKRWWLHVACTRLLTSYAAHPNRGQEALEAIGISPAFTGISVHDGWGAYFRYPCAHALCGVHLLRELTFLAEELGLWWAAKLKALLLDMKEATEQGRMQGKLWLHPLEVADWQTRFLALLDEGDQVHPPLPTPKGQRGKAKQHPARNLLDRLRKHQSAVWAFLENLLVPFDNNLAERDVRMVKVQQKVSGTFRSAQGAVSFCRIRGYLSTLRKQGMHVFSALEATLRGQPLLPSFKAT
jgi:transposase